MYEEISLFDERDGTYRAVTEEHTGEGETPVEALDDLADEAGWDR